MSIGNKKSKKIITVIFGIILVLLIILLVVLTGHKRSLAKQEAAKKAEAESRKRPGASVSVRRRQTGNEIYIQLCRSESGQQRRGRRQHSSNSDDELLRHLPRIREDHSHSRRRNETYLSGRSTPGRQDCYSIRGSEPGTGRTSRP